MLDMPAVIIGIPDNTSLDLRRELANNGVKLADEYASSDSLVFGGHLNGDAHLFVSLLRGPADLDHLQRLSEKFVDQPILVLLAEKAEWSLVFKAIRAGATQVLPLPIQPKDFKEALHCIALRFNPVRPSANVIAFTGATGGCGVTSVALNTAYEIAFQQQRTTILVDCALQMGMVETYLDLDPKYTMRDLLDFGPTLDGYAVRNALTRVADRFDVLVGPPGVVTKAPSGGSDIRSVIDSARSLCEFVVLDLPMTLDERYFDILSNANQVVLLFEQRIPSVRNLQLILDVLPPAGTQSQCHLVINRYDPHLTGFMAHDLSRVLKVTDIQTIVSDGTIEAAVNNGKPLRLQDANSPALADIDRLTALLTGIAEHPEAESTPSFVKKIMRGLRLA